MVSIGGEPSWSIDPLDLEEKWKFAEKGSNISGVAPYERCGGSEDA